MFSPPPFWIVCRSSCRTNRAPGTAEEASDTRNAAQGAAQPGWHRSHNVLLLPQKRAGQSAGIQVEAALQFGEHAQHQGHKCAQEATRGVLPQTCEVADGAKKA